MNLTMKQGKTWVQPVTWLDENDAPVNIAGCAFHAQVRTDYADPELEAGTEPVIELDDALIGGITIDAGDIVMRVEDDVTATIPPGQYLIELEVTLANGDLDQVFIAQLTVEPEVVR